MAAASASSTAGDARTSPTTSSCWTSYIELLVVTDGDASKIAAEDRTAQNVKAVEQAAAGRMFRFADDIEAALGTTKQRNNAANLVALVEGLDLDHRPPEDEMTQLAQVLTRFCGTGGHTAEAGAAAD